MIRQEHGCKRVPIPVTAFRSEMQVPTPVTAFLSGMQVPTPVTAFRSEMQAPTPVTAFRSEMQAPTPVTAFLSGMQVPFNMLLRIFLLIFPLFFIWVENVAAQAQIMVAPHESRVNEGEPVLFDITVVDVPPGGMNMAYRLVQYGNPQFRPAGHIQGIHHDSLFIPQGHEQTVTISLDTDFDNFNEEDYEIGFSVMSLTGVETGGIFNAVCSTAREPFYFRRIDTDCKDYVSVRDQGGALQAPEIPSSIIYASLSAPRLAAPGGLVPVTASLSAPAPAFGMTVHFAMYEINSNYLDDSLAPHSPRFVRHEIFIPPGQTSMTRTYRLRYTDGIARNCNSQFGSITPNSAITTDLATISGSGITTDPGTISGSGITTDPATASGPARGCILIELAEPKGAGTRPGTYGINPTQAQIQPKEILVVDNAPEFFIADEIPVGNIKRNEFRFVSVKAAETDFGIGTDIGTDVATTNNTATQSGNPDNPGNPDKPGEPGNLDKFDKPGKSVRGTKPPLVNPPEQGITEPRLINPFDTQVVEPPLVNPPEYKATMPPLVNSPEQGITEPRLVNPFDTQVVEPPLVNPPEYKATRPPFINSPEQGITEPRPVNPFDLQVVEPPLVNPPEYKATRPPFINSPEHKAAKLPHIHVPEHPAAKQESIKNNDLPEIFINDITVGEHGGPAVFTISLSKMPVHEVQVNITTSDGSARQNEDYTAVQARAIFVANGPLSLTLPVSIVNDTRLESDETFTALLSMAKHAVIARTTGTATIIDDDVNNADLSAQLSDSNTSKVGNTGKNGIAVADKHARHAASDTGNSRVDNTAITDTTSTDTTSTNTASANNLSGSNLANNDLASETTDDPLALPALTDISQAGQQTLQGGPQIQQAGQQTLQGGPQIQQAGQQTLQVGPQIQQDGPQALQTDQQALQTGQQAPQLPISQLPISQIPAEEHEPADTHATDTNTGTSTGTSTASIAGVAGTAGASDTTDVANVADTITDKPDSTAQIGESPKLSINDLTIAEHEGQAVFTVSLSRAAENRVSVNISTMDITAIQPDDYIGVRTTVSFAPGETEVEFTVPVNNDELSEANETFAVQLDTPAHAAIAKGTGTGTITDDDIKDIDTDTGSSTGTETITDNHAKGTSTDIDTGITISITDTTPGIIANDTEDANNTNGVDDHADEFNPVPGISVNDVTVDENAKKAIFAISLSRASTDPVTVNASTRDGSAIHPYDYIGASSAMKFMPGETVQNFPVSLSGNDIPEPDKAFTVILDGAFGASITRPAGTGIIVDDGDPVPEISVSDAVLSNSGNTAIFSIFLSKASGYTISVIAETRDGTARQPDDYTGRSEQVEFEPGDVVQQFIIPLARDEILRSIGTFTVELTDAVNATIGNKTGHAVIAGDDIPQLSIDDVTVSEHAREAVFVISLSKAAVDPVSVKAATTDGSAIYPDDYIRRATHLEFEPGILTRTFHVPLVNDDLGESGETFTVDLFEPEGVIIRDQTGFGTIIDDDGGDDGDGGGNADDGGESLSLLSPDQPAPLNGDVENGGETAFKFGIQEIDNTEIGNTGTGNTTTGHTETGSAGPGSRHTGSEDLETVIHSPDGDTEAGHDDSLANHVLPTDPVIPDNPARATHVKAPDHIRADRFTGTDKSIRPESSGTNAGAGTGRRRQVQTRD